jgi:hypothetical protein
MIHKICESYQEALNLHHFVVLTIGEQSGANSTRRTKWSVFHISPARRGEALQTNVKKSGKFKAKGI